ncbi:hypothetical protein P171DRAFT_426826 [Karstenula rhodostoma CBS 690.94]|uniref:Uncharacterized protein n=1 Tax=Karstenula rhodostoma CBS 690.94 TaxID=1392251 RepID=A0A9P4PUI0_9PLEO|nr:hypothetical protein P171DRAFT_426826 [Karstenula rhodostoma CBS 690.94]
MATILGFSVKVILEKAGLAVLSAAASFVVKKGTDAGQGGSDTEKIRNDIAKVSKDIKSLQNDVRALSEQLTDVLIQLRKDQLRIFCVDIHTTHTSLLDTVTTLFECLEQPETPENMQKIQEVDTRLKELLHNAYNAVPVWLDQIHGFMNERGSSGFLHTAAQRALDQSADFLAYYGKMKTLTLTYWLSVAEGIAILELAAEYPGAHFSEGRKTIARQQEQLEKQEDALRAAIGGNCYDLAAAIFHSPQDPVAVRWKVWGEHVRSVGGTGSSDYAQIYKGPTVPTWFIKARTSLANFDVTIGKKYTVHLSYENGKGIYVKASQYGTGLDDDHTLNSWYIKPYEAGSDLFVIQFQSNWSRDAFDGVFLDTRKSGSSWCLLNMNTRPVRGNNPGGLFELPMLTREERI